ncbi:uncharacterized protein LOC120840363 [Ixodes scapularis]|uniref:uncharacterized protein LOC120840363 n=1 Tax=Ixodes scapularis TaxID=6945 RepID=UPI001A9D80D3|nr:uncharacterized protein LOC120840363 [Ixodes scapularis]
MIHDRKTKEITLIEVGITNKNILAKTELRKSQKYDVLKKELKGYMKQLEVTDRLLASMQSVVLKRTCEGILEDCRRIQRGDCLEDEVDEMMAQLETQPAGLEQGAQ